MLLILSAISWWGVHSGRTHDCGCYGGFIQPSITQSIGINAALAVLTGLSLFARGSATGNGLVWSFGSTVVMAVYIELAQWYEAKTGSPLVDLNPLRVGRRWKHRWAAGATRNIDGEALVTFMGPECPHCIRWVRVANAISQSPVLPEVFGVVATSPKDLDHFKRDKGIRFPVMNVSQSLLSRLVTAVPTTVVIEGGYVKEVWAGDMPAPFVDRFKEAFFPGAR
jgi:hypothetical protein